MTFSEKCVVKMEIGGSEPVAPFSHSNVGTAWNPLVNQPDTGNRNCQDEMIYSIEITCIYIYIFIGLVFV